MVVRPHGCTMAVSDAGEPLKEHVGAATAVLSIVGYAAVVGVFVSPTIQSLFPDLSPGTVNLLADAIAVVNATAVVTLSLGWFWIRRNEVTKHAAAMTTSFVLILLFLAMYLPKVAGGGTKEFVGPQPVFYAYALMLAVHILLSIVAVPVVIYAMMLGVTHTTDELRTETPHGRVGQLAAGSWLVSLLLGVVTYLLLNHVYDWEFAAAVLLPAG